MSIVLAALDTSAAARPVLEVALGLGRLTGTRAEAVHVRSDPPKPIETPQSLAARNAVPFRLLDGPVEATLSVAMDLPEVLIGVVGARSTAGTRRPVGGTALHLIETTHKPIAVVPPDAVVPGPIRRLLVPLEGTVESSEAVLEQLWPRIVADVEVIVLHVFTDATQPAMLDRPARDMGLLGREFLTRHLPQAGYVELRPGRVARQVADVARERASDMVVLSWSQDSSAGRAQVVRDVLGVSDLPVLLLPLAAHPAVGSSRRHAPVGEGAVSPHRSTIDNGGPDPNREALG
jgi:hypothetical protein